MHKHHGNLESDHRIEMSLEHFSILRKGREERLVPLNKGHLVDDMIQHFRNMHQQKENQALETSTANDAAEWFLHPIACKDFLPANIFKMFFASLVKNGLFEAASGSGGRSSGGETYLPSSKHASKKDLEDFFYIGLILAKALVDSHQVPSFFSPSLYKFLLGHKQTLRDLELYNYSLAFHLHEVLAKHLDIVSIEDMKVGVSSNSPNSKQVSKHEYVGYTIQQELFGIRSKQMIAVKKGFLTGVKYGRFDSSLEALKSTDLQILLCGRHQISPHMVIELLNIPEEWVKDTLSTTARDLIDFILHLSSNDLRRFLLFATGHCSPSLTLEDQSSRSKVRINVLRCVQSTNLPLGRPCLRHIDLPDYNHKGMLEEKMMKAIECTTV